MKMTENQKRWALSHDWAIEATPNGILCRDEYNCGENLPIEFVNFQELKEWAGY